MSCITTTDEFKYFVINTPGRWREGFGDSVLVDEHGQLLLAPMLNISRLGEIGHATGLAVDKTDALFIIDAENCRIYKYLPEKQTLMQIICYERNALGTGKLRSPETPKGPRRAHGLFGCGIDYAQFRFSNDSGVYSGGLAFGKSMLYIADTFNHRVQAFYLPDFQIRFVLGKEHHCEPVSGDRENEFDQPKDVVTDRKGDLYVLDYGNKRIQKFDRFGRFLKFFGRDGEHALQKPESLAIGNDGFVYVVDSDKSTVEKFDRAGVWQDTPVKFHKLSRPTRPSAVAIDQNNVIYVGEKNGDADLGIHQFDADGTYLGHFGSYRGACFKLVVDRKGRLYGSCGADGQVFLFSDDKHFEKQGAYYSKVFDSTIEKCQWHRVVLDTQPTEKAKLNVFFHASDVEVDRHEVDKKDAWVHLLCTPHRATEVNDALFRNGAGRYLRLKFEFFGDGLHTYRIRQATMYFQRLSYLRYLPATYQEDEAGRDFLERFLSIFESMSFEVEQKIAGVARYFDPEAVDGEFADWLGTWLAVMLDENWPPEKRKKFLRKAFQLYKICGTKPGLREMIKLFTDGRAAIIEHFRVKTPMVLRANSILGRSAVVGKRFIQRLVLEESSRIGDFALLEDDEPPEKPFEAGAFDFTILADTSKLENEAQRQSLKRLVEEEKPAHTRCFLRTSEGEMQLGTHALLEVNTKLPKGFEAAKLGITSQIGRRTFLGSRYRRKGMIGMRSKIAMDTVLH